MVGDPYIIVEQQAIGSTDLADGKVIALGKAIVLVESDKTNRRELLTDDL